MHDALAAEAAREGGVVGDVVAVREDQRAHAAERVDALEERTGGARRVDEHVAARAHDQVRRGAVRGLGVPAAVVDVVVEALGEGGGGGAERALRRGADARRRAGDDAP